MYCDQCGHKLTSADKFCPHCGATIRDQRRRHHLSITAVVVGLALVLFSLILSSDLIDPSALEEWWTEDTLLSELEPSLEPVGVFASELINPALASEHVRYSTPLADSAVQASFANSWQSTLASVVKVVCEDSSYVHFGSGTNVDPAGYILTNRHVVESIPDSGLCIVGFPDPSTGKIHEAYEAAIIIDEADETGHDLAYLSITAPVVDSDGLVYGYYERVEEAQFPTFVPGSICADKTVELGEDIRVLGYPPLSSTALTVTNGLISSLYSQDGYLITSAKISSGNSGGLAVDTDGCYIGVPTAVYYEYRGSEENYGEIIDAQFVAEFEAAVLDDLERYYKRAGIE